MSATFWLFAVMSVLAVIFCAAAVSETKGKSLEQIERMRASRRMKTKMKNWLEFRGYP